MENPTKLVLLVVSIAMVMFITGCTQGPLISYIGGGCDESNLNSLRCSNNSLDLQKCAKVGDNYAWINSISCPNDNRICGKSGESFACVDGCRYTDDKGNAWGVHLMEKACTGWNDAVNTKIVQCNSIKFNQYNPVSVTDCTAQGKICVDAACVAPTCDNIIYNPDVNPNDPTKYSRIEFCMANGLIWAGIGVKDGGYFWEGNCRKLSTEGSWTYQLDLRKCSTSASN